MLAALLSGCRAPIPSVFPPGAEERDLLIAFVPPDRAFRLDPTERVGIYQTMYFWRLLEVLREDFPKLATALGDDFESLARDYLAAHPSEHPSVRHVGDRLPGFVATHALVRARPWLADLARQLLAQGAG